MFGQFAHSTQALQHDVARSQTGEEIRLKSSIRKPKAHACLGCRNRKVRCDFVLGAAKCTGCQHRGIECELIEPKPRTARAKRNNRLLHLEQRLSRLQSLCQDAGLFASNDPEQDYAIERDDTEPRPVLLRETQGRPTKEGNTADDGTEAVVSIPISSPDASNVSSESWARGALTVSSKAFPATTFPDENGRDNSSGTSSHYADLRRVGHAFLNPYGEDLGEPTDGYVDCEVLQTYPQQLQWFNATDPIGVGSSNGRQGGVTPGDALVILPETNNCDLELRQVNATAQVDLDLHLQTLSMIFADTSETQLLAELHNMTPLSSPVQLPPRDATYPVLTNFFLHYSKTIPIYEEATTFHLLELFDGTASHSGPDLVAYIYSIVALAHSLTTQAPSTQVEASEKIAWTYFGHAARYIPQLMSGPPGLLSIQALLGMAAFLMFNGASKTSLPIISIVLEACCTMHHNDQQTYNARRIAQLYDTAYVLYQRLCLRLGIPTMQHADLTVSPVGERVSPWEQEGRLQHLIGPMLSLASVTRKILDTLNSASDDVTTRRVSLVDLNRHLENWRRSLKTPIRSLYGSENQPRPTDLAQICLQVCYYQAILLINRTSMPGTDQVAKQSSGDIFHPITLENEAADSPGFKVCVDAARETIKLIQNAPAEYAGFMRGLSVHIVRAATILFMNIMHGHSDASCLPDFALLCSAHQFLQTCARRAASSKSSVAAAFSGFCFDLISTARSAITIGI